MESAGSESESREPISAGSGEQSEVRESVYYRAVECRSDSLEPTSAVEAPETVAPEADAPDRVDLREVLETDYYRVVDCESESGGCSE